MSLRRQAAFAAVLLLGACLVALWCVATEAIKLDSPFASPGFGVYLAAALLGELLVGVPYGLLVRALLLKLNAWSLATAIAAAMVPGLAVLLVELQQRSAEAVLGPCILIAGFVMVVGWRALGFDAGAAAHG